MSRDLSDLHHELVHHRPTLKPPTLFSTYDSSNPQHKYLVSKLQQVMEILGYCHSKNKVFGSCFFMLMIAKAKKMGIEKPVLSMTTRNKIHEFLSIQSLSPALKFKLEEIYRMIFGADVQYENIEYLFGNPPNQKNQAIPTFLLYSTQFESYWSRICFFGKMAFEYEQPLTSYAPREKYQGLVDDIVLDSFFEILAFIPIQSPDSDFYYHNRFIETFSGFCFFQPSFSNFRLEFINVLDSNSNAGQKYKKCCELLVHAVEKMIQHVKRNVPSSGCPSLRLQYSDTLLCLEYYKKCVKRNEL